MKWIGKTLIFLPFFSLCLKAQEGDVRVFTLKDVEITGGTKFSKVQILRTAGLTLNEKIEIPGPKINSAIKKLWRSQLFSDISLYVTDVEGDMVTLRFDLTPLQELGKIEFEGLGKGKIEKLKKVLEIKDGMKITENLRARIKQYVNSLFAEKGFPDAKALIQETDNPDNPDQKLWKVIVDKGPRVKVSKIKVIGANEIPARKVRGRGMKNTKVKNPIRIFKKSKYLPEKFKEDLRSIEEMYHGYGFRDANVTDYKVTRKDEKSFEIELNIEEGKRYYIKEINFSGNTVFTTEQLRRVVGYKKGDPYDAVGISKKCDDPQSSNNIRTLLQDEGHMRAYVVPVEKYVDGDSIAIDIIIYEGPVYTFNKVTFSGNNVTHDHVIQRSLRTRPGDLFSKTKIQRTLFDLAGMNFFDAQQINPEIVPNNDTNTVDINWNLVERGSSQIELQGGYGGGRFIGTLGLTFGNFSLRNLFKKDKWMPIPSGDGQSLSLRAQAGNNFQNYSFSFTEPWLGGTKPTALSISFYTTILNLPRAGQSGLLNITGVNTGLNKLLTWPDNYFRLYQGINYQIYTFDNYPFNVGTLTLNNGRSQNISYNISFNRMSQGIDPIFPTFGSEFDISLKITPPFSLFTNTDYSQLPLNERYEWLEFYKVKLRAYWYQELLGKSVLKIGGEFGFLEGFDSRLGAPPFERFFVGGTGILGNRFDGREIIPLRGYQDATNAGGNPSQDITPLGGGTVYNRFLMELRYPISLAQTAKIYALSFFEAGNVWDNMRDFKPFELKRAVGVGIRIFMPAFGLLGFDFGYGFDPYLNGGQRSGWQTHFIIGQQL